jgi:DNA polymerase
MHDVTEVTRAVRQVLESYRRAGLTHLAKPLRAQQLRAEQGLVGRLLDSAAESGHTHRSSSQTAADASRTQQPGPVSASIETLPDRASKREAPPKPAPMLLDSIDDEAAPLGPKLSPQEKADALNVLQAEVSGCTRCSELASTRTQTVFGVGDPCARLVFIGEAPGGDEDRLGEPFVGRAGQLLTDIITKAMKLRRQDVYILNVLKCRPPGNRNPAPNEVINCRGFFDQQLAIIQPEFICCLGSIAAKTLLDTDVSIGRLRKKLHDYRGIPVLCTYHPAYLLRNPAAKRDVWEDIQILMKRMGLPVGARVAGG